MNTALTPAGKSAQIRTAVADLLVVRVDGKQMTKAVYAQLPRVSLERFLAEDGTCWGWVNACPQARCPSAFVWDYSGRAHRHVIGVDGSNKLVQVAIQYRYNWTTQEIIVSDSEDSRVKELLENLPQLYIAV
jgi:hypothetical protein